MNWQNHTQEVKKNIVTDIVHRWTPVMSEPFKKTKQSFAKRKKDRGTKKWRTDRMLLRLSTHRYYTYRGLSNRWNSNQQYCSVLGTFWKYLTFSEMCPSTIINEMLYLCDLRWRNGISVGTGLQFVGNFILLELQLWKNYRLWVTSSRVVMIISYIKNIVGVSATK